MLLSISQGTHILPLAAIKVTGAAVTFSWISQVSGKHELLSSDWMHLTPETNTPPAPTVGSGHRWLWPFQLSSIEEACAYELSAESRRVYILAGVSSAYQPCGSSRDKWLIMVTTWGTILCVHQTRELEMTTPDLRMAHDQPFNVGNVLMIRSTSDGTTRWSQCQCSMRMYAIHLRRYNYGHRR